MEDLYARFGYYTQYRFTKEGVLKVSLISMLRMFVIAMGGPFLVVIPAFFISFTFYPNGVPAGPLLDLFVILTMVLGLGVPFLVIFWSVRVRARAPDNGLPPKSYRFIPYADIKELRIFGRQVTIVTASKKYTATLQGDSAARIRSLEEVMAGRLSYAVQDLGKIRRAKRSGSLGSLLLLAMTLWTYVSFYSSAYYSNIAAGLVALIALLAIWQSLNDVANSTSGNWMLARDWSIAGYYGVWFVLATIAANVSSSLPAQMGHLTLFGSIVPVYTSRVFPSDPQTLAAFVGGLGLAVLAGLFLTLSFGNAGRKLHAGLFRAVGPSYVFCTLLFSLGGIAVYPIFFVLQAAAFLSIKIEKKDSGAANPSPS
jgi:hypothetical protein